MDAPTQSRKGTVGWASSLGAVHREQPKHVEYVEAGKNIRRSHCTPAAEVGTFCCDVLARTNPAT